MHTTSVTNVTSTTASAETETMIPGLSKGNVLAVGVCVVLMQKKGNLVLIANTVPIKAKSWWPKITDREWRPMADTDREVNDSGEFRLLVCGDRNWQDKEFLRQEMRFYINYMAKLGQEIVIIEGEARGADIMAREIAEEQGFTVRRFPADWASYGKKAGPIRNQQMLREGKPHLVLAFHDALSGSKGTKHMVELAGRHAIPVVVRSHVQDRSA